MPPSSQRVLVLQRELDRSTRKLAACELENDEYEQLAEQAETKAAQAAAMVKAAQVEARDQAFSCSIRLISHSISQLLRSQLGRGWRKWAHVNKAARVRDAERADRELARAAQDARAQKRVLRNADRELEAAKRERERERERAELSETKQELEEAKRRGRCLQAEKHDMIRAETEKHEAARQQLLHSMRQQARASNDELSALAEQRLAEQREGREAKEGAEQRPRAAQEEAAHLAMKLAATEAAREELEAATAQRVR